jgi:hypothetical protein
VFNALSSSNCDSTLGSDSLEEHADDRGFADPWLARDKNDLALALMNFDDQNR